MRVLSGDDAIQVAPESGNVLAAATGAAFFAATPASEDVIVQGLDGADTIATFNGLPGITLDGGAGDDDVRGGSGPDVLLGGRALVRQGHFVGTGTAGTYLSRAG